MKGITAWIIVIGISLSGCQKSNTPSAREYSEPVNTYDMAVWYTLPPVNRVSSRDTLIPILRIDGAYYTVCHGFEIPLKECPEGLKWALTPSSMSDTTIGFHGPSEVCSIHIVDRQRASFDDFYHPDEMPPIAMTRVDEPSGLLEATAPRPQTIDDFLGFYRPVWLPWARWEIRKDGPRYLAVGQQLDPPEPPGVWKTRGEPYELTPLSDRLGFIAHFGGGPEEVYSFTYSEALKRVELVKMDFGIRMPLARVSPSSGSDAVSPPLPIGIPAWH